jgi:agmatine deiminase
VNGATPSQLGFYMPAEWQRHEGTWLQWPHDKPERGLQLKVERTWLTMVDVLHSYENVHIAVCDERQRDHVMYQLQFFGIGMKNVDLHIIPTDDFWARDNGPIFVVNDEGGLSITDWIFNGWGERYAYQVDNQVPSLIGRKLSLPVYNPPMVLEGGAVEVNGTGTFLATKTSIIDLHRNPGKSQEEIEAILTQFLGVKHFIWLSGAGRGECEKWGDETDSHIDGAARFTNESTVLYNWTADTSDPQRAALEQTYRELQEATTESGKPLTLVSLPVPKGGVYRTSPPQHPWHRSGLAPAVYTNYYVANGVVLVPVYGNVNDERAKAVIGEQFPGRTVVGIECVGLAEGGGMIHCVTQQQPLPQPK